MKCGSLIELGPTSAAFAVAAGTNVTCNFENTRLGLTRTRDFWANHPEFANLVWNTLVPDSEKKLSMWASACSTSTKKIHSSTDVPSLAGTAAGSNKLMGGYWSDTAKKTTGASRTNLEKARMGLLQQLLAAIENKYGLGAADGGLIASAKTAYCGTSIGAITTATNNLKAFNLSGDSVPLAFTVPVANATAAQAMANKVFWNTTR